MINEWIVFAFKICKRNKFCPLNKWSNSFSVFCSCFVFLARNTTERGKKKVFGRNRFLNEYKSKCKVFFNFSGLKGFFFDDRDRLLSDQLAVEGILFLFSDSLNFNWTYISFISLILITSQNCQIIIQTTFMILVTIPNNNNNSVPQKQSS